MVERSRDQLDVLDARLIALLAEVPRIGVLECARRLRVARGTVQARLDRLLGRGVIRGFGPDISPAALGYGVTAFVTLEIRQSRGHDPVSAHLGTIPEVLEVHTITGSGDLMARIVARSNADLQRVIDKVVSYPDIVRASTIIALAEQLPYRMLPLVRAASAEPGQPGPPTEPRLPGLPGRPTEPRLPGQPGQPTEPRLPGLPGQPADPAEPGEAPPVA